MLLTSAAWLRHYVFQQDGAPARNTKVTQGWCQANLLEFWSNEVWSPTSPDCIPLGYYLWSICERDVNRVPHNTAASLKVKIMEVIATSQGPPWPRPAGGSAAVVEAGGNFLNNPL
jgi:hypothetical protein